MDEMNKLFYSIIENKRQTLASQKDLVEDAEKDLLTLMLEANEDSEDPEHQLSDQELRDDLAIFFLAGWVILKARHLCERRFLNIYSSHDTTSNALSFALYYLAVNPVSELGTRSYFFGWVILKFHYLCIIAYTREGS